MNAPALREPRVPMPTLDEALRTSMPIEEVVERVRRVADAPRYRGTPAEARRDLIAMRKLSWLIYDEVNRTTAQPTSARPTLTGGVS